MHKNNYLRNSHSKNVVNYGVKYLKNKRRI